MMCASRRLCLLLVSALLAAVAPPGIALTWRFGWRSRSAVGNVWTLAARRRARPVFLCNACVRRLLRWRIQYHVADALALSAVNARQLDRPPALPADRQIRIREQRVLQLDRRAGAALPGIRTHATTRPSRSFCPCHLTFCLLRRVSSQL